MPERSCASHQSRGRSVQDIDGARVRGGALKHRDVLADDAYRKVVEAIAVEIARSQRIAEQIEPSATSSTLGLFCVQTW